MKKPSDLAAVEALLEILESRVGEVCVSIHGRDRIRPDWHTGERVLSEHTFYFILDREMGGQISGEKVLLPAGSFVWIPSGVPHSLRVPPGHRPFSFYYFRVAFPDAAAAGFPVWTRAFREERSWELEPILGRLLSVLRAGGARRERQARHHFALLLLWILERKNAPRGGGRLLTAFDRDLLGKHLEGRMHLRPTPATLAAVLGLTPDYFTRVFTRSFGISPKRWMVEERMRVAAARLRETPDSVGRIAESLGYPDVFLFSRQFRSVMGRSPRALRSGR